MAQAVAHCCGMPTEPAVSPPAAAWDANRDWYTKHMSPATQSLAALLHCHLGLHAEGESPPGYRVLETHCADVRAADALLPSPRVASYTACDFSAKMCEAARARLGNRGTVCQADSTELPLENASSFDRYISNLGCCCVSDLDRKLREAYRVLADGGVAAMSMRIEGGEGDSAFALVSSTLQSFGLPAGPAREGLHIGKDLPELRAKLLSVGFKSAVAWRSWVVLPLHSDEEFLEFATSQPPIKKFLATLGDELKQQATEALKVAGQQALKEGAIQVAVAVVVAKKAGEGQA